MEMTGSLPVPSVQAMVAAGRHAPVPPRYLRPDLAADVVVADDATTIPIIDFQRLLLVDPEESARLHAACQDWGFFQLINHGVPDDVMEAMKASIQSFFALPAEAKQQYRQQAGQLEGYGQLFVVSEDQKLDWADVLYLNTQPPEHRNLSFWPAGESFRQTLDTYSAAVKHVADRLLGAMYMNLGLQLSIMDMDPERGAGIQSVRMNYYPPCAEAADKVLGFSPHSDSDLLTLVLQVNQLQGLQIKRPPDGGGAWAWLPVTPLQGAFVVNVGDVLEIFTNGRYRSVEHRALVNAHTERLSIAAFHSPSIHATIGPLPELLGDQEVPKYKTLDHQSFITLFFSAKLQGKSFLERMKKLS
ncbi:naringenin,2-oxoglutarate 3-dioxygenase isoform 2 [Zea mays]|uniref:Protein SRG1 n=2 Tax=Zea mays TaxID=4577 RepID=B4FHR2_MAIZE|nr:naringenin,2-oxoglutarate 3-dioxygenase isoform 2 [Zea mays]ACF81655.1 unknown [Zea mays]AQL10316.1 Protein SRG1 [Zea mays]|eukprot:XP_008658610.1 naringenin,2-oxoglutarate 3-dioxygenase isoform X1 [Zea mays]